MLSRNLLWLLLTAGCASHGPLLTEPSQGGAAGDAGEAGEAGEPDLDAGGAAGTGGGAAAGAAGDDAQPSAGAGGESSEPLPRCGGELSTPDPWASWPMSNPPSSGLPRPASYTASASGERVTDDVSGLVWQRQPPAGAFSWEDAKSYCSCLALDGTSGWRLPTRIELASLVDWTKVGPSIDESAFPGTGDDNYWTSSKVGINPGLVYLVYFLNGHTTYAAEDYAYRVRCVHAAPPSPEARYEIAGGVVRDTATQLSWQRQIAPQLYGWTEGGQYCAALELDGGGWRLPSINELETLVSETQNPAIDAAAFPSTPSEYFWASSTVADDMTRAWTTFFTNGSTYPFAKTADKNVRCVR